MQQTQIRTKALLRRLRPRLLLPSPHLDDESSKMKMSRTRFRYVCSVRLKQRCTREPHTLFVKQDDWEEEEAAPAKPDVSHLNPIKKKTSVKQKIKEKEEEERRRAELGLDVRLPDLRTPEEALVVDSCIYSLKRTRTKTKTHSSGKEGRRRRRSRLTLRMLQTSWERARSLMVRLISSISP